MTFNGLFQPKALYDYLGLLSNADVGETGAGQGAMDAGMQEFLMAPLHGPFKLMLLVRIRDSVTNSV